MSTWLPTAQPPVGTSAVLQGDAGLRPRRMEPVS